MRWAVGVSVVAVAACGSRSPEPLEAIDNAARPARAPARLHSLTKAARPEIDLSAYLPDFHDELRWPLSGMTHPALEPRFPIAQELAIGVSWEQLCERGVHRRVSATQKELLAYLHGWCDVMKRDVDAACAQLTPLLGTTRLGLTPAVRQDLANILVEQGADEAEHWLSKHNIRDIQTLDLLAANFVEVGSLADAHTINLRVMDSDAHATHATQCRRLTKRIVLEQEASNVYAVESLRGLARAQNVPDPLCERLYNKVTCWQKPATDCLRYLHDENVDTKAMRLFDAYYGWPYHADIGDWIRVANTATAALPLDGAAELALTAIEATMRINPTCINERATEIRSIVDVIRRASLAGYEQRLKQLEDACDGPK